MGATNLPGLPLQLKQAIIPRWQESVVPLAKQKGFRRRPRPPSRNLRLRTDYDVYRLFSWIVLLYWAEGTGCGSPASGSKVGFTLAEKAYKDGGAWLGAGQLEEGAS